jgi:hypothetical protein
MPGQQGPEEANFTARNWEKRESAEDRPTDASKLKGEVQSVPTPQRELAGSMHVPKG